MLKSTLEILKPTKPYASGCGMKPTLETDGILVAQLRPAMPCDTRPMRGVDAVR